MTDLQPTLPSGIGEVFDPMSSPPFAALHDQLARARAEEPIFYWPPMDIWVVTRHEDILSILRDPERFTAQGNDGGAVVSFSQEVAELIENSPAAFGSSPFTTEGELHKKMRHIVLNSISPRRMADMQPAVQATIDDLIDGFEADGHMELVSQYAFPLPISVIFALLGFPEEDADRFKTLSDEFTRLLTMPLQPEEQLKCAQTTIEFYEYAADLIEERSHNLGDDFTSDILRAITAGEVGITRPELIELFVTLIVAGHETTAAMISNMMLHLLEDRSRWATVCAEQDAIPSVVEESLRYDPPLIGFFRRTTEAVTLSGVTFEPGSNIWWLLAAGNHDEASFENSAAFQPSRGNSATHLSFGHGAHFCLGAALARQELRLTLETLSRRMPRLELVADQQLIYVPNPVTRHLTTLELQW